MKALLSAFLVTSIVAATASATSKNGFDLTNALIPIDEIVSGGPPRDGIPAINYPDFLSGHEADYLQSDDRVLGVVIEGQARAYPIKVLNWHEVVNDVIGDQHFVVTYCPLCGTGMVFASNVGDKTSQEETPQAVLEEKPRAVLEEKPRALVFGVSGLLYNSDVLLFDRNTESLWSQILGKAVTGRLKNAKLPQLAAFHTSWKDWFGRHPETEVLSLSTGALRDYRRDPYAGYEKSRRLYFDVALRSDLELHPKERVVGVEVNGVHKAYPFSALSALENPVLNDEIEGTSLTIHFDSGAMSAYVTDEAGNDYVSTTAFWFAWYAFYPETQVFSVD